MLRLMLLYEVVNLRVIHVDVDVVFKLSMVV